MARHDTRPTLDLAAGKAVFDADLPRALAYYDVSDPADLGWQVLGSRSLIIPLQGPLGDGREDYQLRLDFLTGRDWPPSARFVNPETKDYVVGKDRGHLPIIQGSEVQVHPTYPSPDGHQIQLVCCSATYEYYDVLHGGDDAILWQPSDTFLVTLAAIGRAMASPAYSGRHPVDDQ